MITGTSSLDQKKTAVAGGDRCATISSPLNVYLRSAQYSGIADVEGGQQNRSDSNDCQEGDRRLREQSSTYGQRFKLGSLFSLLALVTTVLVVSSSVPSGQQSSSTLTAAKKKLLPVFWEDMATEGELNSLKEEFHTLQVNLAEKSEANEQTLEGLRADVDLLKHAAPSGSELKAALESLKNEVRALKNEQTLRAPTKKCEFVARVNLASWYDHSLAATAQGCALASIHSPKEQVDVTSLLAHYPTWWFWIRGARIPESTSGWLWEDGSPWDYTDWYSDQPDNASGIENRLMVVGADCERGWNDYPKDRKLGAVYKCCK